MDSHQAKTLFGVLDLEGNGEVDIEEFVVGIMQIVGSFSKLQQHQLEANVRHNKLLLTHSKELLQSLAANSDEKFKNLGATHMEVISSLAALSKNFRSIEE